MEVNAKDIWSGFSEFFAILAPGILAYMVLLYRVPDLMARFMPRTMVKRREHDAPESKEGKTEEKQVLNAFFILLQAYVLGLILFGFSGPLDLLRSPAPKIVGHDYMVTYTNLLEQFRTNSAPECRVTASLDKFTEDDLCDTARAYILLKSPDAAHQIDELRIEYRLCRSVCFLCIVLACLALYFRGRFVSGWLPLTIIILCAAALFFCKSSQRRLETRKESFRYALILKAMPEKPSTPVPEKH